MRVNASFQIIPRPVCHGRVKQPTKFFRHIIYILWQSTSSLSAHVPQKGLRLQLFARWRIRSTQRNVSDHHTPSPYQRQRRYLTENIPLMISVFRWRQLDLYDRTYIYDVQPWADWRTTAADGDLRRCHHHISLSASAAPSTCDLNRMLTNKTRSQCVQR